MIFYPFQAQQNNQYVRDALESGTPVQSRQRTSALRGDSCEPRYKAGQRDNEGIGELQVVSVGDKICGTANEPKKCGLQYRRSCRGAQSHFFVDPSQELYS